MYLPSVRCTFTSRPPSTTDDDDIISPTTTCCRHASPGQQGARKAARRRAQRAGKGSAQARAQRACCKIQAQKSTYIKDNGNGNVTATGNVQKGAAVQKAADRRSTSYMLLLLFNISLLLPYAAKAMRCQRQDDMLPCHAAT